MEREFYNPKLYLMTDFKSEMNDYEIVNPAGRVVLGLPRNPCWL